MAGEAAQRRGVIKKPPPRGHEVMNREFSNYFRGRSDVPDIQIGGNLSNAPGFFRFGNDVICYGQFAGGVPSGTVEGATADALPLVELDAEGIKLPFDLSQVVENLRYERYCRNLSVSALPSPVRQIRRRTYYFVRPILPVRVRRYLQRIDLNGWTDIRFPHWPVDFTVDRLMERLLRLILKASRTDYFPFIWFWPEGSPSCAIMTHDVESAIGLKNCARLLDVDDSYGIKSAIQVVPEERYETSEQLLNSIRNRGFEVNVHDLNHDGYLFTDRSEFERRAARINEYVAEFRTQGFRSGTMYRNQDWYGAFNFAFDMSVPNVAHLEPQRGGCCTVMPYFIGNILELPLTTIQDYSLFHILGDYSTDIWKLQIDLIREHHGLISFIVHPDYVIENRALAVYRDLLAHLDHLRRYQKLWIALPADVHKWWRNRSQMQLVHTPSGWKIDGPDHEHARVAYAKLDGDQVVYSIGEPQ